MRLQTLVTVAADGMTARARTREWNMTGQYQAEGSGRWSEGVYKNRYVKVNGEWRIAALHYYPTFITDYDEGWTRSALPAPGIDPALPPDAPPSLVFDMFPAVYAIPFHYRD